MKKEDKKLSIDEIVMKFQVERGPYVDRDIFITRLADKYNAFVLNEVHHQKAVLDDMKMLMNRQQLLAKLNAGALIAVLAAISILFALIQKVS